MNLAVRAGLESALASAGYGQWVEKFKLLEPLLASTKVADLTPEVLTTFVRSFGHTAAWDDTASESLLAVAMKLNEDDANVAEFIKTRGMQLLQHVATGNAGKPACSKCPNCGVSYFSLS